MKRDYIDFQDRSTPVGYLITFRCYGTWLHGDERVVTANKKPDAVMGALKANATRAMKEACVWPSELSPWEFRGSKKYLWDDKQLLMRSLT
jgi:hypothetical protein